MRYRRALVGLDLSHNDVANTYIERKALDDLFSATYEELRRLAFSVRRRDSNSTLDPTALVNEAWLKLAGSPCYATTSRLHFKRIAARAMRQVLVEAARRRGSFKRGGEFTVVDLDDVMDGTTARGADLLALEEALQELEQVEPRQSLLVEIRFFGGFDIAETAAMLNISEATVHREWRVVKAWLKHRARPVR